MTVVYKIDPLQDSRWSALVNRHPCASVFHTKGWLEALRRTYGYEPIVFTTSSPTSELQNGIVFCHVRSWLTGPRIVSLPFSDHCEPLFCSSEELIVVLDYLRAELNHQDWKYVEVRPINEVISHKTAGFEFQPAAFYFLHRLSLQPKLNEIFKGLHKNSAQRQIRRAEQVGLVEKCGRSNDLLKHFRDLLVLTRKRHHLPPQPGNWFRNLLDCMGKAVEIRVASDKNNIPVAAILTLRFKDTVVYKYACSDRRFNNLGGMALLLWRAIEDAKAVGAKEFDLGRSDEHNQGLIAFKDHWSTTRSRLTYLRWPPRPASPSDRWTVRIARQVFARVPDGVLTAVGKLLYRHMG